MTNVAAREISPPIPTEESKPFWQAANEGKFLIKRCVDCQKAHWYPRAVCPLCFSSNTEWQHSAGTGVVYSYTIMRHGPQPFVLAFITLDEGPTLISNIIDCDPEKITIGAAVRITFVQSSGEFKVPMFTLVSAN